MQWKTTNCPEQCSQPPPPTRELHPGKQGVKRGTLLKVRHDGTALNLQLFFSQGMGCAIVATVSAGTAGQGMLAKSGWERSTEEKRTVAFETRSLAARSDQSSTDGHRQAGKTPQPGKPREEGEDQTKHGCNSAYH